MSAAYLPLAYWSAGTSTHEGWYNTGGTSPYELNMNVSAPQGPAFGPKARLSKHSLTTGGWAWVGFGSVLLLILIVLILKASH